MITMCQYYRIFYWYCRLAGVIVNLTERVTENVAASLEIEVHNSRSPGSSTRSSPGCPRLLSLVWPPRAIWRWHICVVVVWLLGAISTAWWASLSHTVLARKMYEEAVSKGANRWPKHGSYIRHKSRSASPGWCLPLLRSHNDSRVVKQSNCFHHEKLKLMFPRLLLLTTAATPPSFIPGVPNYIRAPGNLENEINRLPNRIKGQSIQ